MKLFHISTVYDGRIILPDTLLQQLPKTIMLMGTTQFSQQMNDITTQLESAGKKIRSFRGVHDDGEKQILGCDIFPGRKDIEAYLYVGDGLFHPTALLYGNEQPVYYYNPFSEHTEVLTKKHLQKVLTKQRASMARFLSSNKIGVLVTTKPGQNNIAGALELKKRLEAEQKQVFIFIDETLNLGQLDNFPFVDCWVNTACPRIIQDSNHAMINLWDLRDTIMKGFGVKVV
jgi:2-(3-amino-3-carboxypropyl)histidine synthase